MFRSFCTAGIVLSLNFALTGLAAPPVIDAGQSPKIDRSRQTAGAIVPIPAARNLTIVAVEPLPIQVIDAIVLQPDGGPSASWPTLSPVGYFATSAGEVALTGSGRDVWQADVIAAGAFVNTEAQSVMLVLGDGRTIVVPPNQAVFVGSVRTVAIDLAGNGYSIGGNGSDTRSTHHWECQCQCSALSGGHIQTVTFNCSNCQEAGNQCAGSDGGACQIMVNGVKVVGTLSLCGEILVPN